MDHSHCHCISLGWSESHITSARETEEEKERRKKKVVDISDAMCCFCGKTEHGKLRFVQVDGHGLLRHTIQRPLKNE